MRALHKFNSARHLAINRLGAAIIPRVWRRIPAERVALVSRYFNVTVNFVLEGALLWLLLWLLIPGLLGDTASGMQTLAGAIPATIVALFVFTLGALVAIAQLSINAYGHRAALMLVEDYRIAVSVIRPLILAVASLVLAGQISDGAPPEALTAAFATLALLTLVVIVQSVGLLGSALLRYTAPITFTDMVTADVGTHLSIGVVQLVRWKVPMLEEMAKLAIRRGDSAAVTAALGGLREMAAAYVAEVPECPQARQMPFEDEEPPYTLHGWLGEDLRESLVRIGEDTLRQGAPSEDSDHTVDAMEEAAAAFIRAGLLQEAKRLIDGLIALGCTSHQVGSGYINQIARPGPVLVRLMKLATQCSAPHLAGYALAGWTLVIAYADEHFGKPDEPLGRHPNWGPGLASMGAAPPWEEAGRILETSQWQAHFANQMNWGVGFVGIMLGFAMGCHEDLQQGRPLKTLPTPTQMEDAYEQGLFE